MSAPPPLRPGPLPKIRGTQVGLRIPDLIDQLKSEMPGGSYRFEAREGQIGGVRDRKGTYHVIEGHHRLVAAIEIYFETGNTAYVTEILRLGRWTEVEAAPTISRPLPSRRWWGRLRNWLGM
jgi:hypothetical protein